MGIVVHHEIVCAERTRILKGGSGGAEDDASDG